jgi:hypothetical protein
MCMCTCVYACHGKQGRSVAIDAREPREGKVRDCVCKMKGVTVKLRYQTAKHLRSALVDARERPRLVDTHNRHATNTTNKRTNARTLERTHAPIVR